MKPELIFHGYQLIATLLETVSTLMIPLLTVHAAVVVLPTHVLAVSNN
ncbi:hypothetical protein AAH566_004536 [Klebsiella michiganensis]